MRRSPLVVVTAVLALTALVGCSDDDKAASPSAAPASGAPSAPAATPSDEPTVEKKDRSAPAIQPFGVSATGFGPYQVEETQADIVEAELVEGLADAAGCTTGTGTAVYNSPKVFFSQGKLVLVKATGPDAKEAGGIGVGSTLAEAQAKFPAGKQLAGSGGAQGWHVVQDANAMLFEVSGDKVTAVSSGVATSVEKNFTTGSGC